MHHADAALRRGHGQVRLGRAIGRRRGCRAGSEATAQLAAEDFGGHAAGLPVQILSGDHQNHADTDSALARRWFDTDGVDVVVDLSNSAIALAVGEVARSANRVALVTAAVASRLTGDACSPNLIHYSLDTWY